MSDPFNNNAIELELQVRLMNLVLGEASDFERDQLQELMEQRSELAVYYQQLQHVHGLLCEVGAGDPSVEFDASTAEDAWQLPADRRGRVLTVLDKQSPKPLSRVTLATKGEPTRWRRRLLGAAMVASVACVLIGLLLPSVQSSREAARRIMGGTREAMFLEPNRFRSFPGAVASDLRQSDTQMALPIAPSATEQVASSTEPNNGFLAPGSARGGAKNLNDLGQMSTNGPRDPEMRFGRSLDPLPSLEAVDWDKNWQAGGIDANGNGFPFGNGESREYGMAGGGMSGSEGIAMSADGSVPAGEPQGDLTNHRQLETRLEREHYDALNQAGGAAVVSSVPSIPEMQVYDKRIADARRLGRDSFLSDATEGESLFIDRTRVTGGLEESIEEQKESAPASEPSPSFTVPDGGTVLLGGVPWHRADGPINRLYKNLSDNSVESHTPMMTVTPRIIISEEVLEEGERRLSESTRWDDGTHSGGGQQLSRMVPESVRKKEDMARDSERVENFHDPFVPDSEAQESFAGELQYGYARKGLEEGKSGTKTNSHWVLEESAVGQSDFVLAPGANAAADSGRQSSLDTQGVAKGNEGFGWKLDGKRTPNLWNSPLAHAPRLELATADRAVSEKTVAGKPVAPEQSKSLDEQSATTDPFSTFSLHVSDVSFKLAQAALSQGQWPDATQIRIEDFVNALDYRDPLPNESEKVACRIEQAIHPFLMQRNLLRVSMRTAATGRSQNTPLRLTLLLDNSGSMERPDRRQAVLRAFQALAQQLSATDQITLISFANTPRLLADKVAGNQGESLLQLIENLPSEGGTNIEAALVLAHEKAAEQQLVGAQNRIVLLTDGAVNLGDADPDSLARLITQMRDSGIAFDAAGISARDLNDHVLEALTRQGDGRYYLLDSAAEACEDFAAQIAGALRPSAQNVKVQIEFNPERVGRYKLLGFEKHRLHQEDFRNDKVDAAEMAAAEAGVAMYQFEIKPNGRGDVGSVSVRFRDVSTGRMIERRWPIPYESNASRLEHADPSLQLAAAAALFAAKLAGGPLGDHVDLTQLQNIITKLPERVACQPRVQQLRSMIDQANAIGP